MLYRVFIVIGMLVSAVLWAGFGWQVLGKHHVIPYDPPLRCLHVALPLAPGHTLSQTILGRSHGLSGVALAFRTTAAAAVAVAIHEEAPNGKATPLAAATLALPANHPFYTVHVVFPSQLESEGKTYAVHVRGLDEQGESGGGLDTAPLAWSCWSNAFAYGELLVDGELAHGDLFLQPLYQRGAVGAVQTIVARFQGIRVSVFPAWLWWACLIVALLAMPTLVVWAAGGRVGSLPNLIALLIVLPLVGLAVYWGDPRLHRPVVQAGEPASVVEASTPTTVNLLHELRKQAVGEIAPQETWDRHLTFALEPVALDDGERRLVLRTSVNTTVTWRNIAVPPDAVLSLEAVVDQGQWTTDDGPIVVRVTVVANGSTLLEVQENLIDEQGESHRLTQTLDLSAHTGQTLTLTLATQGETRNSANMVIWPGLAFD